MIRELEVQNSTIGFKCFNHKNYKTSVTEINNACTEGCYNEKIYKRGNHYLISQTSEVCLQDPLFQYIIKQPYSHYILKKSGVLLSNDQIIKDRILPQHNPKAFFDILKWTKPINTDNKKERDSIMTILLSSKCAPIINWLTLMSMYIIQKKIKLESFQKIMIAHAIIFEANTRASESMFLLEPLILSFLDMDKDDKLMSDCRSQQCINIVPRRMGKSFVTQIMIATLAIVSKTSIGYGALNIKLCNSIKNDIVQMIGELYGMIADLPEHSRNRFPQLKIPTTLQKKEDRNSIYKNVLGSSKTDLTLKLKFQDGNVTCVQFLTLANKHVSSF